MYNNSQKKEREVRNQLLVNNNYVDKQGRMVDQAEEDLKEIRVMGEDI